MFKSKALGAVMVMAGTAIGGGMLALPLMSAQLGLVPSCLILCVIWAMMAYTALLTLEVVLPFPEGSNFSSLSEKTLGPMADKVTLFCNGALYYSLLAAYFTGSASFLKGAVAGFFDVQLSHEAALLIVTVLFGGLIAWKTSVTESVNKVFFLLMGVAFALIVGFLLPHASLPVTVNSEIPFSTIALALPIFFASFGFHGSIPTSVDYLGRTDPKRLRYLVLTASLIPLIVYIVWQVMTLGVLRPDEFGRLLTQGAGGKELTAELIRIGGTHLLPGAFDLFSQMALLTSLLGVGLGLFDFFRDHLRWSKCLSSRPGAAFVTFLPPLLFALFYPDGFIKALGFAGFFGVILVVFLPILMAARQRSRGVVSPYLVPGGKVPMILAFALGLVITGSEAARWVGLL